MFSIQFHVVAPTSTNSDMMVKDFLGMVSENMMKYISAWDQVQVSLFPYTEIAVRICVHLICT
jgi:hypothetical protein